MSNSRNIQILMVIGGVVNLLFAGVIYFMVHTIQSLSQDVATQETLVLEAEAQDSKSRQLATTLEGIGPAEEQLKAYFVSRGNSVDFIEYLEGLSVEAGVEADPRINKVTGALQFNITYEGRFDDVLYYIALVESLPYNIVVESVSVEEVPNAENSTWRGSMRITLPGSGTD